MCLGVLGKIVSITPHGLGVVDFDGITREVSLMLCPEAEVGDYILVHVGFAIRRLDPEDAQETLRLYREIEEIYGEETAGSG